jgi:NADPH-dependent 2,4-dienoyl-CoA reductase/sulfur reductase-like enzyme
MKVNRRKFLNATSLAGAGMCLASPLNAQPAQTTGTGKSIRIPETYVPITSEADVVVIGGGPAGFGAAMRAARSGVKTLLIERYGGPGGAATSGYMCVTAATTSTPTTAPMS